VGSFADSAPLSEAGAGRDLDDFGYRPMNNTRVIDGRTRLRWLEKVTPDHASSPYAALTASYRPSDAPDPAEDRDRARRRRWILATTASGAAARILTRV
jgi:hypothetical protein